MVSDIRVRIFTFYGWVYCYILFKFSFCSGRSLKKGKLSCNFQNSTSVGTSQWIFIKSVVMILELVHYPTYMRLLIASDPNWLLWIIAPTLLFRKYCWSLWFKRNVKRSTNLHTHVQTLDNIMEYVSIPTVVGISLSKGYEVIKVSLLFHLIIKC